MFVEKEVSNVKGMFIFILFFHIELFVQYTRNDNIGASEP